jgi:glycine oxidase
MTVLLTRQSLAPAPRRGNSTAVGRTLIIGGGVIGLGIAWELARQGQKVTVLERGRVGDGASGAAAGMLCPMAELDFVEDALLGLKRDSLARYPAFCAALEAASGIDAQLRLDGTLTVALDRDDAADLRRHFEHRRQLDLPVQWMSGAQVRAMEPALSPRIQAGIHTPSEGQIDNRLLLAALARAAYLAGVQIRENTPVQELIFDGDRVRGVRAPDPVDADTVVLAAGAWARQLGLKGFVPATRPVRGEMLGLRMEPVDVLRCVVRAPDCYLVPRSDGRLIVGATSDEVGFDERVTAGGVFELLRGVAETLPGMREFELLDTWSGLRPGSLDNDPLLGHTGVAGLVAATGHYRNGILLLPATVHYVAHAVLTGQNPKAIAPFHPQRFGGR